MSFWNDEYGYQFWAANDPALWSPTRQSFAATLNQDVKFLRSVKPEFLRGDSDAQVRQERNGGFILQVVGSTPTGGSGSYRVLADKDDYAGTLIVEGFLNRYITVMGSFMFLAEPANALPSGSDEGLLKSLYLGSESGDVKPIFGAWYAGPGATRPINGGSTRVLQKSGTYNSGDDSYNLALFAGAEGGEDEGRLMLYEDAPHGVAFQLTFLVGPRCER